jgi:hypothetical protein
MKIFYRDLNKILSRENMRENYKISIVTGIKKKSL